MGKSHKISGVLAIAVLVATVVPFVFCKQAQTTEASIGADPFNGEKYESGYIHVAHKGAELFYWLVESRNDPAKDPLIVWLTGGPGCSSELAALVENGPWDAYPNGTLRTNKYSWTSNANVLYVDQPLGTGFSIVGDPRNYVTSEKGVAKDMREFFVKFLEKYPKLAERPVFLMGESYAGHYVPAIAGYLTENPIDGLNLSGIAIGNGFVDPISQYEQYPKYALDEKLINKVTYDAATLAFKTCVDDLRKGKTLEAFAFCNSLTQSLIGNLNPYDIRQKCEHPPLCYDFSGVDSFLNRKDVQQKLGVKKEWKECSKTVYIAMIQDWTLSVLEDVTTVLESGIEVLVYSGDQDYICNWYGGRAWTDNTKWSGQKDFLEAPTKEWKVNGTPAGTLKEARNLSFLRIYGAGHMVPMDVPLFSLKFVSDFISKGMKSKREVTFSGPEYDEEIAKEFEIGKKAKAAHDAAQAPEEPDVSFTRDMTSEDAAEEFGLSEEATEVVAAVIGVRQDEVVGEHSEETPVIVEIPVEDELQSGGEDRGGEEFVQVHE